MQQTSSAGPEVETKVQAYLKKVRDGGGAVLARIAMVAARGILLSCDKTKLVEFGGHVRSAQQILGLCPIEMH